MEKLSHLRIHPPMLRQLEKGRTKEEEEEEEEQDKKGCEVGLDPIHRRQRV